MEYWGIFMSQTLQHPDLQTMAETWIQHPTGQNWLIHCLPALQKTFQAQDHHRLSTLLTPMLHPQLPSTCKQHFKTHLPPSLQSCLQFFLEVSLNQNEIKNAEQEVFSYVFHHKPPTNVPLFMVMGPSHWSSFFETNISLTEPRQLQTFDARGEPTGSFQSLSILEHFKNQKTLRFSLQMSDHLSSLIQYLHQHPADGKHPTWFDFIDSLSEDLRKSDPCPSSWVYTLCYEILSSEEREALLLPIDGAPGPHFDPFSETPPMQDPLLNFRIPPRLGRDLKKLRQIQSERAHLEQSLPPIEDVPLSKPRL